MKYGVWSADFSHGKCRLTFKPGKRCFKNRRWREYRERRERKKAMEEERKE